jgi:hypothetical protein
MHLMSRSHHDTHELDAGPPPEVLSEIEAAWERAQGLPDIHFEADHETGRAFASIRGRRISARQAVLVACGDALIDPRVAVPV